MENEIDAVAREQAEDMGRMVNISNTEPAIVALGTARGLIAFWMGCMEEGARTEGLDLLQQMFDEEVANMKRGIANGMVPA